MVKRKRGRPVGGKHPEPIREYWRQLQRSYRANLSMKNILKNPLEKPRRKHKK